TARTHKAPNHSMCPPRSTDRLLTQSYATTGGVAKSSTRIWSPQALGQGRRITFSSTASGEPTSRSTTSGARSVRRRDLSMELVANQAVSPGWMVSGTDQFRRTVAGGLVAMGAVRPLLVVELPPTLDQDLRFGAAAEPF